MYLVPFIGHGRSATAMAAYEGQSGSKDRGDLQVSLEIKAGQDLHENFPRPPTSSLLIFLPT